jgi:hypothetical protein
MKHGIKESNEPTDDMIALSDSDASDSEQYYHIARACARDVRQNVSDVRSVSRGPHGAIGAKADKAINQKRANHRTTRQDCRVLRAGPPQAQAVAPKETLVTPPKNKVDNVVSRGPCTRPPAQTRIAEIGEILALGYLRLLARKTRGKAGRTGDS